MQEPYKGAYALIRVEKHGVPCGHLGYDRQIRRQGGAALRGEGLVEHLGVRLFHTVPQREYKGKIQRGYHSENIFGTQLQQLQKPFCSLIVQISLHLQPYGGQLLALFKQLLHYLTQIHLMVVQTFLHLYVRISRYADYSLGWYAVILEYAPYEVHYHIFRKYEAQLLLVGKHYHTGECAAEGHQSELYGIFGLQVRYDIDRLVFQKREGVVLVHHLRCQKRAYLRIKISLQICFLIAAEG